MTITWESPVNEIVWESQTAPGITWTTVVGGTSSGGGVTVHNDLSGRSAADAHPMSAITDLEPALTDIATAVQAQQGDIGTLQTAVAGKQAADADLTAIAALAPADDALIQRKAGAWTSRTPAQVKADMSIGVGDVSGLDENTRDVIGTALVAGSGVAVTVDDPGNTITIAVSGVVADAINDGTTTVAPSQNAVYDALAMKAPIASPALTGNPTAPTQAQGNNTTRIATTEFVHTEASLLVPKALVDAKGDLLVATAPDTVARLPVGTDGQVLVADSAQAPGVKWAGAAAGITNGMPRVSGDTVRAFMVPGVIVQSWSTDTPSANRTVFQPIRLDRQRTFDQIQIEVTAASVSGSRCRTAIYAVDDYWQATDLLFDSGQMANDAIAVVTAGISLTLPSGNYMMVTVSQGSAAFRVAYCLPPWLNAFKAAAGAAGYLNVFTAGSNTNVANGFPAVSDATTKFEGATGTTQVTIAYYARLREAA